jgi:hypothetical protein
MKFKGMKKIIILSNILLACIMSFSQGVAINQTNSPADNSAMLDIQGTGKGLLIPRLTTAQIFAIPTPATGLLVFNTSLQTFFYRSATQWQELMISNNSQWANSGTYIYNSAFIPVSIGNNGYSTFGTQLGIAKETTTGNTNENVVSISHASSGTPVNGIGAGIIFNNQFSPGSLVNTGKISSLIENVNGKINAMEFDVPDTNGIYSPILYARSGVVGIGTTNPAAGSKLDVNGAIHSSSLSGAGNRAVYADAGGNVSAIQRTYYLSIPATAFKAKSDINNFNAWDANGDCFFNSGSADAMITPVYLPNGATLTRITFYYIDNSASDMNCQLLYHANNSGSFIPVAFLQTSGASPSYSSILTSTFGNPVINNQNNLYSLWINPANGNWTGNNLKIKGVLIEYLL